MRVHATIVLLWSTILYSTVAFVPTGADDGIVTAIAISATVLAGTGHSILTIFSHAFDSSPNDNGTQMPSASCARAVALKSVALEFVLMVKSIFVSTLRFTAQYLSLQLAILMEIGCFAPSPKRIWFGQMRNEMKNQIVGNLQLVNIEPCAMDTIAKFEIHF